MPRLSVSVLLLALAAPGSAAGAQTGTPSDFLGTCPGFIPDEVLFVGRAGDPETHHISGAVGLEQARQIVARAQAAVEPLRAAYDPKNPWGMDSEGARALMAAERALIAAHSDFDRRRAASVPPYDLTLIPMHVEQALRGSLDSVVMVHMHVPSIAIEPGERYAIRGVRSSNYLPFSIELGRPVLDNITEYVDVRQAASPEAVQPQLAVLAAVKGATIAGSLTMQNFGDVPPRALKGTRVVVSSGTDMWEAVTNEDGLFLMTGLKPGLLQIQAVLPKDQTLTSGSSRTTDVAEGGCAEVRLTANVNGRVRGRIFTTASPLEQVRVKLLERSPDVLRNLKVGEELFATHAAEIETSLKPDGTFDLYGVPPGWYVLSASMAPSKANPNRGFAYYPGTPHMAYATPIEVGNASVHDGFDFALPVE